MIGVGDFRSNEAVKRNLNAVVESGRLTYGKFTVEAESRWAYLHDCRHAIAVSSGTAALHIALLALKEMRGWKPESEVIIPATTFVATINTILHAGLTPRIVDIRAEDALMATDELYDAITENTVAIIPVHLFGQAANMTEVMDVAKNNDLCVIEDSCEAFLATHNRRKVGSFGEFGCFSTYVAHHIPAGIGGFLTTNDMELNDIARSLINHGRDIAYFNPDMRRRGDSEIQFLFHRSGLNYRSTEVISAIVCGLLDDAEKIVEHRRALASIYDAEFEKIRISHSFERTWAHGNNYHSRMMYPVLAEWVVAKNPIDPRGEKFKLMEHLWLNGVDSREALPLINQPYMKDIVAKQERNFPVADHWNECGLYLPCHQYMTREDVHAVMEAILSYKYFD